MMRLAHLFLLLVFQVVAAADEGCSDNALYSNYCAENLNSLCQSTDPERKEFAEKYCKESCGFCKKVCDDDDRYKARCPEWKHFCEDLRYIVSMEKYCQKTCGLCEECMDSDEFQGRCVGWITFCKKDSGSYSFMEEYCRKTCGLCGEKDGGLSQSTKPTTTTTTPPTTTTKPTTTTMPPTTTTKPTTTTTTPPTTTTKPTTTTTTPPMTTTTPTTTTTTPLPTTIKTTTTTTTPTTATTTPPTTTVLNNKKACAKGPSVKGRVIGGIDAIPHSWPWQVALKVWGNYYCGGTLVSPLWVMTAAHCVARIKPHYLHAYMGVHKLSEISDGDEMRNVVEIVIQDNYDMYTGMNDIALLKLDREVVITEEANFACLPEPTKEEVSLSAMQCYITGWGKTELNETSNVLQQAQLPVVTNEECVKINTPLGTAPNIAGGNICAGTVSKISETKSGCRGDSGGPFACVNLYTKKWTVEGVVNWGSSTCTAYEKYTVFARVSFYRDWIDKTIEETR